MKKNKKQTTPSFLRRCKSLGFSSTEVGKRFLFESKDMLISEAAGPFHYCIGLHESDLKSNGSTRMLNITLLL
jgi:hypothetical protein